MKITRCTCQQPTTLEGFFRKLGEDGPGWRKRGEAMIALLEQLRAVNDPREVYALTSHDSVCFGPIDDYRECRCVRFQAFDSRTFHVEYLMPNRLTPWARGAKVYGEANTSGEAVAMILIAMDKSEGWGAAGKPPSE